MKEGRVHVRRAVALVQRAAERAEVVLASPAVGFWRPHVGRGASVLPGDLLGELEVLGAAIDVIAPDDVRGLVVDAEAEGVRAARLPVGFGARLCTVDPHGGFAGAEAAGASAGGAAAAGGALAFTSPLSGRYFARPGPGKAAFVAAGAEVTTGQTICLLEVMKTFHRVTYGGPGLPERARVAAILVEDEADVTLGQAILHVEELP